MAVVIALVIWLAAAFGAVVDLPRPTRIAPLPPRPSRRERRLTRRLAPYLRPDRIERVRRHHRGPIRLFNAITMNPLTSGSSNTNANNYNTASVTPTGNRLILIACSTFVLSGTAGTNGATGNGITYTAEVTRTQGLARATVLRGMAASPTSGAINITSSNTVQAMAWSVAEFAGVDTSGTNGSGAIVQTAVNSSSSANNLTVTLASFGDATNNAAYGSFGHSNGSTAITPGLTNEIHDVGATVGVRLETEWQVGEDTTVSASWSGNLVCIGLAIEIKAAGPVIRGLSNTGSITAAAVRTGTFKRTQARTGTFTAARARVGTFKRAQSRTGSITAAVARRGTLARLVTRSGSISAAVARLATLKRALSRTGSITAAVAYRFVYARGLTRSGTFTAVVSKTQAFLRTPSRVGTFTAAVARQAALARVLFRAKNMLLNGGFETDTSNWVVFNGATINRITSDAYAGAATGQLVRGASASDAGMRQTTSLFTAALELKPYTLSAWVKLQSGSAAGWRMRKVLSVGGDDSVKNFTPTATWQRIEYTFTPASAATYHLRFESAGGNADGTILLDEVQFTLANGPVATLARSVTHNRLMSRAGTFAAALARAVAHVRTPARVGTFTAAVARRLTMGRTLANTRAGGATLSRAGSVYKRRATRTGSFSGTVVFFRAVNAPDPDQLLGRVWVIVKDTTGAIVGQPIYVDTASYADRLDRNGEWAISLPAMHPAAAYFDHDYQVDIYREGEGLLFSGIIDTLETEVD